MSDQPAYEVPPPGLPFPPREKRRPGWPIGCVQSWRDGLTKWEAELLGSQGENFVNYPAPDATLGGKPAKFLKVTTIGALRHTLECAYAYIKELEGDRESLAKQLQETEARCVTRANLANFQPNLAQAIQSYANFTQRATTHLKTAMSVQEETIARDRQLLANPDTPRKKFWAAYQRLVLTVESKVNPWTHQDFTLEEREDHAHTGFLTELGEILDIEKKHQFYGKPYDINHITEEIGDLLWYAALYSWVNYQVEPGHNRFLNSKMETGGYDVDSSWIIKDHIKCLMGRISNWNTWAADTFMPEVRMVRDMYRAHGCDIPPLREIARRNIFKLLDSRYKSGSFSQEEAVNRDLAEEAEKLRGTGVDGNSLYVPEPEDGFTTNLVTAGTGHTPEPTEGFDPEDDEEPIIHYHSYDDDDVGEDSELEDDYDDFEGSDLYDEDDDC